MNGKNLKEFFESFCNGIWDWYWCVCCLLCSCRNSMRSKTAFMLVTFHTAAHIISFHFRYLLVAISHPRDGDSIRITWIELQEQQSPLSQFHLLTNTLSHYCPHLIHSNMNFMLLCLFITRLYKTYANMYYKYPAHVLPEEIWMNQGKTKYIFANQTLWTACRNAINRIIVVHIIWCDFN